MGAGSATLAMAKGITSVKLADGANKATIVTLNTWEPSTCSKAKAGSGCDQGHDRARGRAGTLL